MPTRKNLEAMLNVPNVQKFLGMIAQAEDTVKNGYATAFGGGKLSSLADHPRTLHVFTETNGKKNKTSAAGRYQFLRKTWDDLKQKYDLPDFGARSQDIGAVALLAQSGALNHVLKGDFASAVKKAGTIWASLPSSPYAQNKRSWSDVNKMLGNGGYSGGGGGTGGFSSSKGSTADLDALFGIPSGAKQPKATAQSAKQSASTSVASDLDGLFGIKAPKKPFVAIDPRAEAEKTVARQQGAPSAWQGALLGASDLGAGVLQGFNWLGDKAGAGINAAFGTNIGTGNYEAFNKQRNDADSWYQLRRQEAGKGFDVARLAGNIVSTAPLAAGTGGASLGQVALNGAAVGGLIGGVSYAPDADQRAKNMLMGAGGGAAGAVLGKGIGTAVNKGVNIAKGRMAPAAQEVASLGDKFGVRTTAGDITQSPAMRGTEIQLENVPLMGMKAYRAGQQAEAKGAAEVLLRKLQKSLSDTPYKNIDKLQQAAGAGDKNALRIMNIVNGTGDDAGKILQASAEIKSWRGQKIAEKLFDKAGAIAGNNPVNPKNTVQAIDDIIAKDSKVSPNTELLNEIGSIRSKLNDPSINVTFGELRAARSRLGELVDEWGRQGKSTSGLTKVRAAIEDDIANFANKSANPQLVQAYRRADTYYKGWQQSKAKGLAQSLRSNEPDKVYDAFIKAGSGDKAANFYRNLDPKGQAALRYEMANRALEKATSATKDEAFSPAKFAGEFERMNKPFSNIFQGEDKAQMAGFVKLMRHIDRAGQYAENPATGNRAIPYLIGGAAFTNPATAVKAWLGATGIKALLTTKGGQRILLAANDAPPGSVKLDNLLKMAQSLSTTTGANAREK